MVKLVRSDALKRYARTPLWRGDRLYLVINRETGHASLAVHPKTNPVEYPPHLFNCVLHTNDDRQPCYMVVDRPTQIAEFCEQVLSGQTPDVGLIEGTFNIV